MCGWLKVTTSILVICSLAALSNCAPATTGQATQSTQQGRALPSWDLDFATVKYDKDRHQSWAARYNGPGNANDRAEAVDVDEEGNVYVTGASQGSSNGTHYDYAIVKYDKNGNQSWVARYHGPGYGDSLANAIAVDKAGNVYVTGGSEGKGGLMEYATVKYDRNGREQWAARYASPGSPEQAHAIGLDESGNVYVTGSGNDGCATIKYDGSGRQLWLDKFEGGSAFAMALDGAGNVYTTGYVHGNGGDYLTLKYDSGGTRLWAATYDGPLQGDDVAYGVAVDGGGNIYVTGRSQGASKRYEFATVKYDSRGARLWVARYSGPANRDDEASKIALDGAGDVYVTGGSARDDGNRDFATIKYDDQGNQAWAARYRGPDNGDAYPRALAVDRSGNAYVAGSSGTGGVTSQYVTVKYDSGGKQVWATRYHGPGAGFDSARGVAVDAQGNVYVTGESSGEEGLAEMTQSPYPGVEVYGDPVRTITVSAGQELAFGFDTAPRLGLAWTEQHDGGAVSLLDSQLILTGPMAVAGKTWFLFKTLRAGYTSITFTYSHGGGGPVRETKTFQVVIK